jgi:hypothetical protein
MHPQLRKEGPLLPVEKALPSCGEDPSFLGEGPLQVATKRRIHTRNPHSKGIISHKNLTPKRKKKKKSFF